VKKSGNIWNAPNGILTGLGKNSFMEKNQKQNISWRVPLKSFTDHKVRKYKEYYSVCPDSPERKEERKNEDWGQQKGGDLDQKRIKKEKGKERKKERKREKVKRKQ
jgi:hypothetical protein